MPENDRLLDVKEMATLLGVHPETLKKYCQTGVVPFIKLGGKTSPLRFDPKEVREAIREENYRKRHRK